MILVFLAKGFEEIEALATVDVLRRAELDVRTVGVTGMTVVGAHGMEVAADCTPSEIDMNEVEAIVLPGGMPGTLNLEHSPYVQEAVDFAAAHHLYICAICAAPTILGHKGLLSGHTVTCFPGYEDELPGATVNKTATVITDGTYITARGAGLAVDFGLEIVRVLVSGEKAEKLRKSMQCR